MDQLKRYIKKFSLKIGTKFTLRLENKRLTILLDKELFWCDVGMPGHGWAHICDII